MQGRVVNFLLDTNVVSEWAKPLPGGGVAKLTTGPGFRRAGGAQGAARQGCAAHADYET